MVRDKNTIYAEKNEEGVYVYQDKSLQDDALTISVTFPNSPTSYITSANKSIGISSGLLSLQYVDYDNGIHIPNMVPLSANQVFITNSDLTLTTINKEDIGL